MPGADLDPRRPYQEHHALLALSEGSLCGDTSAVWC